MGLFDNLKQDVESDMKKLGKASKQAEQKLDTKDGRKLIRYGAYILIALVILSLGYCTLKSCTMGPQEHKAYIRTNYVDPYVARDTVIVPVPIGGTTVVNHTTVNKIVPTPAPIKPTVGTNSPMTYPKVKTPGDVQAAKDKAIDERKAKLKAAQEARKQPNSTGFNSFSKKSSNVVNLRKKK
jgi:hypothetical protein